ncbi:two-component system capsular synthesis response regulator RcsB [Pseudomonas frederiksbergensis]|uniref:response regulator n=1 Tax=Pseudomonas frederiksbergensis TaxID=104087 RepID=UPI003D1AC4E2
MRKIKVVIADDHPIVLVGVRELIQRDERFTFVGEAVNSSQLIDVIGDQQPDLVITDFNMPGDSSYGDGLKLIEYLTRHYLRTQVLVLTMITNRLILTRLHELGVAGVIQKNHLHDEIAKALDALAQRRPYRSPEPPAQSVLEVDRHIDERVAQLSLKELEIVRLFVAGLSVSDIARTLNRSIKTVSAQKVSAMRKLDVDSDQSLMIYCISSGAFQ